MKKLVILVSVLMVLDLIFLAGFLVVYAQGNRESGINQSVSEKVSGISVTSMDLKETKWMGDSFPNAEEAHWNHMPLSYDFNNCSKKAIERIRITFLEIEQKTSKKIYFIEEKNPDISITCYDSLPDEGESKTVGEASYQGTGNIIRSAQIDFYKQTIQTNYPFVEVHEVLHVFGIDHKQEKSSVMYPETTYFNNYESDFGEPKIDADIIEKLNRTYGQK